MRLLFARLALALAWLGLAVAPCASAEVDAIAQAASAYRRGDWEQAAQTLSAFIAAQPDHPRAVDATFYYGETLVQLGRWQEARKQFTSVLERDPGGKHAVAAAFRAGEAAYMSGEDQAAQRELDAFRAAHPDHPLNEYALPYLGSLALQQRDVATAEQRFADSLARFPQGPLAIESRYGLAQAQQESGKLSEARDGYRAVSREQVPLAEQALVQLAGVENKAGAYAEALADLDAFEQRFPTSPLREKAQLGRGFALYKLGRFDEANQTLAPLAKADGSQAAEAAYWLAMSQGSQDDWRAAIDTLAGIRADDAHPLAAAIAYQHGESLLRAGDGATATSHFDRVLSQFADSPWADDSLLGKIRAASAGQDHEATRRAAEEFRRRFADSPLASQAALAQGQANLAQGDFKQAIAALLPLVDGEPAADPEIIVRANAGLAIGFARSGDFKAAEARLAALRSLAGNEQLVSEATNQVAEAAQAAGDGALAQRMFARVGQAGGSQTASHRAQAGLAWNHFEAGRWADAAAAFQELLTADPKGSLAAEAALLRGRSLEHLEDLDGAEAMYRTVIEQHADSSRAAEALWCSAQLAQRRNQTSVAAERYARLLADHQDFSARDAALYYYGSLLKDSDPDAAQRQFEQLRTEFPASRFAPQAALRLAERAIDRSDDDDAGKLLAELTAGESPADVKGQALYLAGRAAIARGDWAEARQSLEELLAASPSADLAIPARYLVGEALFREGKYEEAIAAYAQLAEQSTDHTDSFLATAALHRAQALAQLRRWTEAAEAAQAIAARFPSFDKQFEADYLVGRAYAAQADFDSARQWYSRSLAAPQSAGTETAAMTRWMLGESYLHQQKYEAALAEYLQVDATHFKWHAAALLQAGKAQESLGRWQLAADLYEQLLSRYPAGDLSAEATRRLAAARGRAVRPSNSKPRN